MHSSLLDSANGLEHAYRAARSQNRKHTLPHGRTAHRSLASAPSTGMTRRSGWAHGCSRCLCRCYDQAGGVRGAVSRRFLVVLIGADGFLGGARAELGVFSVHPRFGAVRLLCPALVPCVFSVQPRFRAIRGGGAAATFLRAAGRERLSGPTGRFFVQRGHRGWQYSHLAMRPACQGPLNRDSWRFWPGNRLSVKPVRCASSKTLASTDFSDSPWALCARHLLILTRQLHALLLLRWLLPLLQDKEL